MSVRPKESIGPNLLSVDESRSKSVWMLFAVIVFSVLYFYTEFSRLPLYLESTLLFFTAFRTGHVIHRLILLPFEKDVLNKEYQKSKILVLNYVIGDLIAEPVLCGLTVLYYYRQCSERNGNGFLGALCVCTVVAFLNHLAKCPGQWMRRAFAERHNLNIGYGLAYFYYHNYLAHLVKDGKFTERLRKYVCEEEVLLSSYKLFILVPYNCVVEKYIDHDPCESLRTKETKPLQLDVAGIKGRIYVNTVYELFPNGPNNYDDIVRCVIECAQPLKQLRELYTMGKITEDEMVYERRSFIFNLEKFLQDDYDSCRTVILVPCNGRDDIVPSVLSAAKSLGQKREV